VDCDAVVHKFETILRMMQEVDDALSRLVNKM
jgi:hypothetical protein